ncbi:diguanylate cyclase domain-containing protein [Thiohalorhabdus methylotrophus]|uniref:diguanylate cyclase domain-containing protein n=1 Tax=Thiohalorhabdus methylotrophus TaxID=3242694 RepID=UPI0035A1CB4A
MTAEIPIARVMNPEILHCPPDVPLSDAARRMTEAGCSSIVIMADGEPQGIWTERDALGIDLAATGEWRRPIAEFMAAPLKTVEHRATLGDVAVRFKEEGVRHLLVVTEDGSPCGVVTQTDVVLNQGMEWYLHLREVDSAILGAPLILPGDRPLDQAAAVMNEHGHEAALVRGEDGTLGILTERDVVRILGEARAVADAGEAASQPLLTVPRDYTLLHARNLMVDNGHRHLGVTDADGGPVGLISFDDILSNVEHMYVEELSNALKERDTALSASRHHLRLAEQVIETSLEGIMITDAGGRIESVNPAFTHLTGYTEEEVLGRTPGILSSGYHDEAFYRAMWDKLRDTGGWQGEIWNRRKNGEVYPELLTITAIPGEDGEVSNYAGIFSDITQLKENEERIRNQAYYDPLTELPNRRLFQDRLSMAIAHGHRQGSRMAVLFLDLDHFKPVNDRLGHAAGDRLLVTIAERLRGCVREDDTIARMGGDEFIILATELEGPEQAARVARRILATFHDPMVLADSKLAVSGSIGISLYPDDSTDAETLVRNADAAMYRSKSRGRNSYHFYEPSLDPTR